MITYPQFLSTQRACLCAVLLAAATLATAVSAAQSNYVQQSATVQTPLEDSIRVVDLRLHVAGNVRLSTSNDALFGQSHVPVVYPSHDSVIPPVNSISPFFEFPAGSHTLHLYEGGLWIGGILNGDTLVSTAIDAQSVEVREFSSFDSIRVSSNMPGSKFYDPSALSQQQHDCHYYDTLHVDRHDPRDGRPHVPLGLEVTQTSHAWLSEPYDDFIIVVYHLRNISDHAIDDLRIGVMCDADIYTNLPSVGPSEGRVTDDVSGYLSEAGIAYAMDNDGDPVEAASWDSTSARSVFGVVPLAIDPVPCCTTFNWWSIRDTGPWLFGGYTPWYPPIGDREMYSTMATDSIGIDQLYIAATEDGSPRDPRRPLDGLAAGTDTRILLAFGTYNLQPGDSVRFVCALVAGDSVHQDPSNFATNFNASDPQRFFDNLYFGDLIRNANAARFIYDNGYDLIGGAPPRVSFKPLSDHAVEVHWVAAPFRGVAGYRIFRRIVQRPAEWEQVGETVGANALYYTDRDLSLRLSYEYTIAAVGADGQEGFKSRPAKYKPGLPLVIPSIEVVQDRMRVTVKWSVAVPKATFAPPENINIYRRTGSGSANLLASVPVIGLADGAKSRSDDRLAAASRNHIPLRPPAEIIGAYQDEEVESGTAYWYSLSVTNTFGLEGPRSKELRALPMALNRPGIVVVERQEFSTSGSSIFINEDSSNAFFFQWGRTAGFDSALAYTWPRPRLLIYDPVADSADFLTVISRYQTVVFADEARRGTDILPGISIALGEYVGRGGQLLLAGCDLPLRFGNGDTERVGAVGIIEFEERSFTRAVLGIERAISEYVAIFDSAGGPLSQISAFSAEFAGARSLDGSYPDLKPDSARASATLNRLDRIPLPIYGGGLIPAVGALLDFTDAEPLYTYEAGFPDTSSMQGLPVAIRSTDPERPLILINLPLSVMERESALRTLDVALDDLDNVAATIGRSLRSVTAEEILDCIYHPNKQLLNNAYDTNGDGVIDLRDVVQTIKDP